jgi:SAM-dependent methyltransferase
MTTREDVRGAYRYLLGREPESEAVLDRYAASAPDMAALRARFLATPEFYRNNARDILRYLTIWNQRRRHGPIEHDCRAEEMGRLFAHIRSVWSRLGEVEPHFSVFSQPGFKPDSLEANLAAFERSGESEVELLRSELAGLGLRPAGHACCVELGCGVGRVTRYLAGLADHLYGFDISQSHLALARDYMSKSGVGNVTLAQVTEPEAIAFPRCDLFYSRIVLQHNPPPVIRFMLRRMLASLSPGGIAVFQLPTFIEGYSFHLADYLAGMDRLDNQELHALPQRAVFDAIREADCDLVSMIQDNSLSKINQVSNRFVVQKR